MPRHTAKRWTAMGAALATAAAVAGLAATGGSANAAATPTARPFPQHTAYKVGVMPSVPQADRDAAVERQYDSWKATYLHAGCSSGESYISSKGDNDAPNGGPVSEGQGYGMNIVPLMAGYDPAAQTEFNALWSFVKSHEDQYGLMQWKIDGKTCKYADSGVPDGATDGDLDIGYGLILADKQWGGYTAEAKDWLAKFYAHNVAPDGHLKCEDDGANDDTRPSDFMIDHLRAFAAYDTAHDWNKVVHRTEAVVSEFTGSYSPGAGLLSDFVVNANTTSPKPAPANYQEGQPDNIVGYNSIRVPWHLGTDALLYGATTAAVSYNTAKLESACLKGESGADPQKVHPHTKLNCTPYSTGDGAEEAGDSVGPAAMAAGDQAWTDTIWKYLATNPFGDGYFGETIKTLVYVVMAGDYWNPTDSPSSPSPSPSASPSTSPTGTPSSTPPSTPVSYEAEKATLAGGAYVSSCAHCSSGAKISGLGHGGTVTFTAVSAASSGDTKMTVSYMSVGQDRTAVATVNGTAQSVTFPQTPDYNTVATVTVTLHLNAGSANTVEFSADASGPNLDRISV
ncbi:glycosyl hydrolase family 8 [Kitasatospora sp. NPDC057015]|uniref:glycosyl hydrolase family 8 n=1 Tax=Kitasatospora sp. NPDC057015 TaxID=3346001 RepID=UPI00362B0B8E